MFIALFGYPFLAWYAVVANQNNLEDEETQKKMVNLYAEVRIRKEDPERDWNIAYYPIFLLRRIVFVALPTFLWVFPYFQIQCLLMFTSLYIIFYAGTRPHNSKERSYIEIFNEILVMVACYHMVCFSEFNLSPLEQFNMGYSFVAVFAIAVIANIGLIVAKQVINLRRMRKFKLIKKARLDVFIARRKLNQENYAKQFGIDDVKYYDEQNQFVGLPAVSQSQPSFVQQKTQVVQEAQGTQNLRHLSKIKIQKKLKQIKKNRRESLEDASPMSRKIMQMELAAIAERDSDDDGNEPTGPQTITRSMTASQSNGSLSLPANSMSGGEQHVDSHALNAVLRDKSGNASLADKSDSDSPRDGEQNNLLFNRPETTYTESVGGFSPSSPSGKPLMNFGQAAGLGLKLQKTQKLADDNDDLKQQPKIKASKTLRK